MNLKPYIFIGIFILIGFSISYDGIVGLAVLDNFNIYNGSVDLARFHGSNRLCIKNNLNSSFTSNCNSEFETLLYCPGVNKNYTCTITNNNYRINNLLDNSVIELPVSFVNKRFETFNSCIPSYECTEWFSCINFLSSRTCYDNKCNSGAIVEFRDCIPANIPVIVPPVIPIEPFNPITSFPESVPEKSNFYLFFFSTLILIFLAYFFYYKKNLPAKNFSSKKIFFEELKKSDFAFKNNDHNLLIQHYTNLYNIYEKLSVEDQDFVHEELVSFADKIKRL